MCPIRVLSADRAAAARTTLGEIERDWLTADLPHPPNTYRRVNTNVVMPFVADLARDPDILDVIGGILGPDIMIYATEFFAKEPKTSHVVNIDQDLTYRGLGAIHGMVPVWVALSPATTESGCMDFVRSSHNNAILPH
ncbi:MAG: phytanoyl-CoA dioxygenase family protein, partial [Pseudomonadota bacterium]